MPVYTLQVTQPPLSVFKTLDSIISKFFWGTTDTSKKLHWSRWKPLCVPVEEGGLGVRNLEEMCEAFSLKLWFRFREQKSLWAVSLLLKYCKKTSPNLVSKKTTDSVVWKRLLSVRTLAESNCFWKVGTGSCYFWQDDWSNKGTLANLALAPVDSLEKLEDFGDDSTWDWPKLSEKLPINLAAHLSLIPFSDQVQASPIWKASSNGLFSTKSGWDLVRKKNPFSKLYNSRWGKRIPNTIAIFWWKVLHNWLPVDKILKKKGITIASKCQCCFHEETIMHVLLFNTEVHKVWVWFSGLFQVQLSPHANVISRYKHWLYSSDYAGKNHIRTLVPILIGWFSWLARNEAKHKGKAIRSEAIILKIMNFIQLSHMAKPFERSFWLGDFQIAEHWLLNIAPSPPLKIQAVYWEKPPAHWVKMNTDGSFNHLSKKGAAGGILRDEEGRILKCFQTYLGETSVLYAELLGIWQGLKTCTDLSLRNVIIESDSQVAILLIQSKNKNWHWKLSILLEKILQLCANLCVRLVHVYREGNAAADWLANEALRAEASIMYDPGEVPTKVRQIAYTDKWGLAYLRTSVR